MILFVQAIASSFTNTDNTKPWPNTPKFVQFQIPLTTVIDETATFRRYGRSF